MPALRPTTKLFFPHEKAFAAPHVIFDVFPGLSRCSPVSLFFHGFWLLGYFPHFAFSFAVMDRSRSRPRRALHNSAHDDFFGMPSVPNSTPTIGRLRRVLLIIDLSEIRHVAEELCHSDSLQVTRCSHLPVLTGMGGNSAFYVFQVHPCIHPKAPSCDTGRELLTNVSDQIWVTPGMFRSTLMSWISDGMTAQATLLSCATSTFFVSYFMPIDLNGVVSSQTFH